MSAHEMKIAEIFNTMSAVTAEPIPGELMENMHNSCIFENKEDKDTHCGIVDKEETYIANQDTDIDGLAK